MKLHPKIQGICAWRALKCNFKCGKDKGKRSSGKPQPALPSVTWPPGSRLEARTSNRAGLFKKHGMEYILSFQGQEMGSLNLVPGVKGFLMPSKEDPKWLVHMSIWKKSTKGWNWETAHRGEYAINFSILYWRVLRNRLELDFIQFL